MNQVFAASLAFVIAFTLWGLGRKPKRLISNGISRNIFLDESALVAPIGASKQNAPTKNLFKFNFQKPTNPKECFLLRKNLKKLISSGPEDRLLAIRTAHEWGDSSVIPILRLGLKDMDSLVVVAAAEAIAKFRGNPQIASIKKKSVSYPLNVSLMR